MVMMMMRKMNGGLGFFWVLEVSKVKRESIKEVFCPNLMALISIHEHFFMLYHRMHSAALHPPATIYHISRTINFQPAKLSPTHTATPS